jgi:hypothetical protein
LKGIFGGLAVGPIQGLDDVLGRDRMDGGVDPDLDHGSLR